jgi:hypothetical protein
MYRKGGKGKGPGQSLQTSSSLAVGRQKREAVLLISIFFNIVTQDERGAARKGGSFFFVKKFKFLLRFEQKNYIINTRVVAIKGH